MAEKIKFTDEELKEYLDLQAAYQNNIISQGQLNIRRYQIDDAIAKLREDEKALMDEYLELQKKEDELLKATSEKYGEGSLDIKTGEFTPSS